MEVNDVHKCIAWPSPPYRSPPSSQRLLDERLSRHGSGVRGPLGHYTIEPSELTLPAGKFELVVTNVDPQLAHSLVC